MFRPVTLAILIALGVLAWLASPWLQSVAGLNGRDTTAIAEADGPDAGEEAAAAGRQATVRIRHSTAEPIQRELILNGRTQAHRLVELGSELSGQVVEVLKEKGERVAAGELLLNIDRRDREAALAEAQATLAQRQIEDEAARRLGERGFQAETRVAEARAALEQARYLVRRAEVELSQTEIRAPFAGLLEERPVEVGSFLREGDAIGTVVELDPLLVVTDVPEASILNIGLGDRAEIELLDGTRHQGVVSFVARQANAGTRTFRIEIDLPNRDLAIPAGISASVVIALESIPAHPVSPGILVLDDRGVLGVSSVRADGTVGFHAARIVRTQADTVWLAGLPPALDLITVGQGFVTPGQTVSAVPEEAVSAGLDEQAAAAGAAP